MLHTPKFCKRSNVCDTHSDKHRSQVRSGVFKVAVFRLLNTVILVKVRSGYQGLRLETLTHEIWSAKWIRLKMYSRGLGLVFPEVLSHYASDMLLPAKPNQGNDRKKRRKKHLANDKTSRFAIRENDLSWTTETQK